MKKIFLTLSAVLSLLISSCGDKTQADLLSSVPVNTKFLTVINQKEIIANCGKDAAAAKNEIVKLLDTQTTQRGEKSKNEWEYVMNDENGIDPESLIVLYEYKNATLATFRVTDEKKFREGIENKTGEKLTEGKDKLWASDKNRIFTKGKQVWITSGYPELSPSDLKLLSSLKEEDNILSLEKGKEIAEGQADISFLYYLQDLMQFDLLDSYVATGLNLAYNEPTYLSGFINFENGKAEGEMRVLNQNHQPSKRALAPGKIDMGIINKFQGKGNIFLATNLSSNVISTVMNQIKAIPLFPEIKEIIGNVNGNVIIAIDSSLGIESDMGIPAGTIMLTMNNDESALAAKTVLEEFSEQYSYSFNDIRNDGNLLFIEWGEPSGASISEVSQNFNNCNLGVVALSSALGGSENASLRDLIKDVCFTLADEGEGSVIRTRIDTKPGMNSFISLINAGNTSLGAGFNMFN